MSTKRDPNKVALGLWVDKHLKQRIQEAASNERRNMSNWIVKTLEECLLDEHENNIAAEKGPRYKKK